MKNILTLLFILSLTPFTYAQLELETFQLKGEAINLKADSENQLHVVEYVIDSIELGGEWYYNNVLYSKYDDELNWIFSVPLIEEVKDTNAFLVLRDRVGSALHIDATGEARMLIRMRDSMRYDGIWYEPYCEFCYDLYYAHFNADGEKIESRSLDFTRGREDGGGSALAFTPEGNLSMLLNSNRLIEEVSLPNGDTLIMDTSVLYLLMQFDKDLELDTFKIWDSRVNELHQTDDFIYVLNRDGLTKLSLDLEVIWKKEFTIRDISSGLCINPDKSITIGGSFTPYFIIDGDTTFSTSSWDNAVFNISNDGELNWMDIITGNDDDDDLDVACDRFGNNYYYGDFEVDQQFGDSLYQVDSGLGQVLGKYVNGQPVQSFSLTDSEMPPSNWTFMSVADDYIYFFLTGRKNIYRFCISEADEDCNGFLVDTEEVLARQSNAQFYPNPTTGLVDIQSDVPLDDLQLFDALGRQLPLQRTGQQISLENLPTGTYYLTYQIRQQRHATPIIKW